MGHKLQSVGGLSTDRINQFQLLFIALVLLVNECNSLHLNHLQKSQDPKEYDKNVYYSELGGIQSRFKRDVKKIQDEFTQINLQLSNTNISSSDQVIYLQETLAQERDSLFNIQTYLAIPFALRSCQCVNVTDDQKNTIETQVNQISGQIDDLQQSIGPTEQGTLYENPQCPQGKCAAVQEILDQIKQLRIYSKILNDTITSQCCRIVNYYYRDNLVDKSNWFYGNLTEKDYRLATFERSKQYNLTQCPQLLPFADFDTNECFSCPDDLPLFRLDTRICVAGCDNPALVFNSSLHNCDFNRTCFNGRYFNNVTSQCQKDLGTSSYCPKSKPVWNKVVYACQACATNTPYFDPVLESCRACTANQRWVPELFICSNILDQNVSCPVGTYYNSVEQACQQSSVVPSGGTYSKCPPEAPFWSTSDYACFKCPSQKPNYNITTQDCEACPANKQFNSIVGGCVNPSQNCESDEQFDEDSQQCVKKPTITCKANEVFNTGTNQCQEISSNGQIGLCPPEAPNWNAINMICQKCKPSQPKWNTTTLECEACPNGSIWQPTFGICRFTPVACPSGQTYNSFTSQCSTTACTGDTPRRNPSTGICEQCPQNTVFNGATGLCQKQKDSGSLPPSLRTNISSCSQSEPYWNSLRLRCQQCPSGEIWNQNLGACVSQPPSHHLILNHFSNRKMLHELTLNSHLHIQNNHLSGNHELTLKN